MFSESRPQVQTDKGQPYQPISGHGTRLQLHPVGQDPPTIDQRLYSANSAISESLNILSSNRNTIASLTRTCTTYQQRLEEWSKAYTALEIEHKKTSTDLGNMTQNHVSMSQQFKEASQYYESSVQGYERRLQIALGHHPSQNMNQGEMREYNDKLTAANQELNVMREMKREHQSDLREAHDQLDTAQQDLGKLRKEKEDLIREYEDALHAAENRIAIAKEKNIELEEQQSYKQLILRERVTELEKEVDLTRKNRDALDGTYEAAEKKIDKLEKEKADLMQNHRDALATAEARIAELEMEKVDLIQKRQDTLATAEEAAEKRIADLENEKAELIQKHLDVLAAAEDRAMVVPESITEPEKEKELENMHPTAESGASATESPVASPETTTSPITRKRPRFESKQDGQQQYRKVRGRKASRAIDGDTIIVKTE
ncbi:hypothetical protein BGZ60DRAFT_534402 [Tricladium varicosporioides]|nr:hypothetical protein BGZ60DRAFT_534402 [Hymenoscyphus varicosporioides]